MEMDGDVDVMMSFIQHILSIPLLPARLSWATLPQLTTSITSPTIWPATLSTLTSSHVISSLATTSPSYTSFDDRTFQVRVKRQHRYGDDEDDDEDMKRVEEWRTERAKPASNVCWMLGNILEWSTVVENKKENSAYYSLLLSALKSLILAMPATEFPGASSSYYTPLHPLLITQLSIFQQRSFLDRLCQHLLNHQHTTTSTSTSTSTSPSTSDISSICVLLDALLYKWSSSSSDILNTLVFSTPLVPYLWRSFRESGLLDTINTSSSLTSVGSGSSTSTSREITDPSGLMSLIPLFCTSYSHLLIIQDDEEFFEKQNPFPLTDVIAMVELLKNLLHRYYWLDFNVTDQRLRARVTELFKLLRERQSRRSFCPPHHWLITSIPMTIFEDELRVDPIHSRASIILRDIPFVLSFTDRARIFTDHIEREKLQLEESDAGVSFEHGHGTRVRIRRDTILEDGFAQLNTLGTRLKGRVMVEFIDQHGVPEPGLDGGGLFKDFLTSLSKIAFDPSYGYFSETSESYIYPNPASLAIAGSTDEVLELYAFIGRIIGKALYDGITVEPQFANFFLRFVQGRINYVDDLSSLDPALYKSLMKLKTYDGDVADLELSFCVDKNIYGGTEVVDLIPDGRNIPVTKENRMRFIYAMADYKLNKEIRQQSLAFVHGMSEVISLDWLRMFAAEELRLLISGDETISITDLKANTNYAGGYSASHQLIIWLWDELESWSSQDRALFLRFATSCSRAPLLGFRALSPKFCIQHMGNDDQLLPTAATCMNLLRIPRYSTRTILREKMLYAIRAGAGFGLT